MEYLVKWREDETFSWEPEEGSVDAEELVFKYWTDRQHITNKAAMMRLHSMRFASMRRKAMADGVPLIKEPLSDESYMADMTATPEPDTSINSMGDETVVYHGPEGDNSMTEYGIAVLEPMEGPSHEESQQAEAPQRAPLEPGAMDVDSGELSSNNSKAPLASAALSRGAKRFAPRHSKRGTSKPRNEAAEDMAVDAPQFDSLPKLNGDSNDALSFDPLPELDGESNDVSRPDSLPGRAQNAQQLGTLLGVSNGLDDASESLSDAPSESLSEAPSEPLSDAPPKSGPVAGTETMQEQHLGTVSSAASEPLSEPLSDPLSASSSERDSRRVPAAKEEPSVSRAPLVDDDDIAPRAEPASKKRGAKSSGIPAMHTESPVPPVTPNGIPSNTVHAESSSAGAANAAPAPASSISSAPAARRAARPPALSVMRPPSERILMPQPPARAVSRGSASRRGMRSASKPGPRPSAHPVPTPQSEAPGPEPRPVSLSNRAPGSDSADAADSDAAAVSGAPETLAHAPTAPAPAPASSSASAPDSEQASAPAQTQAVPASTPSATEVPVAPAPLVQTPIAASASLSAQKSAPAPPSTRSVTKPTPTHAKAPKSRAQHRAPSTPVPSSAASASASKVRVRVASDTAEQSRKAYRLDVSSMLVPESETEDTDVGVAEAFPSTVLPGMSRAEVQARDKYDAMPSWDSQVSHIDALERDKSDALVAWVVFNDGNRLFYPTAVANQRCPQALLAFYERHVTLS